MPRPIVAVFGSSTSLPGDGHYESGVRCGRLLAEAGYGLVTGGYGGIMEAASRGASAAGGDVIGITAPTVFPDRAGANPFVVDVRAAASLSERIHQLLDGAAASIALHGSIGTFAELTMAWNLAFAARFGASPAKPVVAVGDRWRRLIAAVAAEVGTDPDVVTCVDDVDQAVAAVRRALG